MAAYEFQIGEDSCGCKYGITEARCEYEPVYECSRGTSDLPQPHQQVLFLAKYNGHWTASLGSPGSALTTVFSHLLPVFRTSVAADDPREPGMHEWMYWDGSNWKGNMIFKTYRL